MDSEGINLPEENSPVPSSGKSGANRESSDTGKRKRQPPPTRRAVGKFDGAEKITMPMQFFALAVIGLVLTAVPILTYGHLTDNQTTGFLVGIFAAFLYVVHSVVSLTKNRPENLSPDMADAMRELEETRNNAEMAARNSIQARRENEETQTLLKQLLRIESADVDSTAKPRQRRIPPRDKQE